MNYQTLNKDPNYFFYGYYGLVYAVFKKRSDGNSPEKNFIAVKTYGTEDGYSPIVKADTERDLKFFMNKKRDN